jgi:hypothetical protein
MDAKKGHLGSGKTPDVTGFDVEATDGHIGKIDEASYDEAASCLVVDTGFWIFGKKRMIPARAVQRVDPEQKKVFVNMTKDVDLLTRESGPTSWDPGAAHS